MYETGSDLNSVITSLLEDLRITGEKIDNAADKLLSRAGEDPKVRESVQAYTYPFWTTLTGHYLWS